MKKTFLFISTVFTALVLHSQVVVSGVSPVSIQRNFEFGVQANEGGWPGETDNGSWGMALDFNVDGTYIQAELMLVEDGTSGTNLQGNPISQEGCNTLINDLTGKIAVIYRNTCSFSTKVFNAQEAGALAVVVINREDALVSMLANTDPATGPLGTDCTIPAVFLSNVDGAVLTNAMANGPVTLFIGNKFGIYTDDLGSSYSSIVVAKQGTTPKILAQNGTEFNFTPGIEIVNYGSNTESNVFVNAVIDAPGQPAIYNEVVGPLTLNYKDTISIFEGNTHAFPNFSMSNYPVGEYTLTYNIITNQATPGIEQSPGDNSFSSKFYITDDLLFSYARQNIATGEPVVNSYPKNYEESYKSCIRFTNANASRVGVSGLYSSIYVDTADFSLQAQDIFVRAYEWNGVTTFSGTPTYDALVEVTYGNFNPDASYQNGDEILISFVNPFVMVDNQNYLFCVETYNAEPSFGYDGGLNYNANLAIYDEVLFPIYIDNFGTTSDQWFNAGWNGSPAPSIGLKLFPEAELGVTKTTILDGVAYPNPAVDNFTISLKAEGNAQITMTDVAGRIVLTKSADLVNGKTDLNIAALNAGVYAVNVVLENGKTAQFNVVKK